MNRVRLLDVATVVVSLCALASTGLLVRREFASRRANATTYSLAGDEPNWRDYAAEGRILGDRTARVTIVEFADYQCPYCQKLERMLDSLSRVWPGRVKVVYRHLPLPNHEFALPAARASECASEQGRFGEMHRMLYAHADSFGIAPWWSYARKAEVGDSLAFELCMSRAGKVASIERDAKAAQRLFVRGTPTLLIGRIRLNGVPSAESLSAYIDRAERAERPKAR